MLQNEQFALATLIDTNLLLIDMAADVLTIKAVVNHFEQMISNVLHGLLIIQ